MVVQIIDVIGASVVKPEDHPPVATDSDGLKAVQIATQGRKTRPGKMHI
jgi:hypothetical protein